MRRGASRRRDDRHVAGRPSCNHSPHRSQRRNSIPWRSKCQPRRQQMSEALHVLFHDAPSWSRIKVVPTSTKSRAKDSAEHYFLSRPPAFDGASAAEVGLRSEPDRRAPERRSPTARRSSSDRVSRPLRRSLPDRRPAFARLSSMAMLRLRWSRGIGMITHTTHLLT
jgi:hypothetical protein